MTAPTTGWAAPAAPGPVRATVTVPGSKSVTNRALVLAALAGVPSTLHGALRSRDTELMAAALRSLGVAVDLGGVDLGGPGGVGPGGADVDGPAAGSVVPGPLHGDVDVDCGLAGTVMRFLPPLAALADGDVRLDGDPHARTRPMGTVLWALRSLGVEVAGDALPFAIRGRGAVRGGEVVLDASASSQFVSGLLLSGARYDQGLVVRHQGPPVPSQPHLAMTVAMLREAGVAVDDTEPDVWRVAPGPVAGLDWAVEPDLSNATPFLAAAAVTGGTVTVPGWPAATTQPGDAIRGVLERMGAEVTLADGALTVTGPEVLAGVELDLRDVGELTPTIAALCAVADGPSMLRGIAHLRGHETDRLAALVTELTSLGCGAAELADGIAVRPAPMRAPDRPWHAYADHRMATAGAVLGLVVPGLVVDDVDTTAKTLPGFDRMWAEMLGQGS